MAVLVVEDNPQVRASLSRILARTGFEVDEAENGLAALSMLERRTYQAVVCDIKMPVMDGVRMYQLLERAYPAVARRVVFVSAWLDDAEVQAFLERAGRPFLRKPFDIDAFLRTVRVVAEDADQEAPRGPGSS